MLENSWMYLKGMLFLVSEDHPISQQMPIVKEMKETYKIRMCSKTKRQANMDMLPMGPIHVFHIYAFGIAMDTPRMSYLA